MHEFIPGFSCLVTEAEFLADESLPERYADIYILCADSTLRHFMGLSHGRHIMRPVDKLPGAGGTSKINKESFQFLPDGPVPYDLYVQAHRFFVDVMKTFDKEHEAMLHILWNKEDGYHIKIPKQEVNKASVKYTHDHIGPNDAVVVDIHSHQCGDLSR